MRTKVCVSFDYENDKYSRNAIRLWDANKNIDFDINDLTPSEINSSDIGRIKSGLSLKINQSDILLVICGKYINQKHRDYNQIGCINWQNWECKKALDENKKIIVVKLDSSNPIPEELYGHTEKRTDVVGLEKDKIKTAIDNLYV